jgi:osmotically inducible protein OsmC
MPPLYSTKVIAKGGRHGSVRSDDGLLDLSLALPKTLGGSGGATNPEQLFAAGYAACFENALLRVSREAGHHFSDDQVEVVAEIGLNRNEQGNFVLSAVLGYAGRSRPIDGRGIRTTRASNLPLLQAIRGNIEVATSVTVR